MTFYVERSPDGKTGWVCLAAAQHQIGPNYFHGMGDNYPPQENPNSVSAMTGLPGWKCRVRFDDDVLEVFEWDKIQVNPNDPESDFKWGWKSIERNYKQLPVDRIAGPLSFLG